VVNWLFQDERAHTSYSDKEKPQKPTLFTPHIKFAIIRKFRSHE